jgi:hypothetical protein
MFGRFLELGIATTDIAGSVLFYERLGFSQLITGDAWSHRYGVLSDGRLHLGFHERSMPSPSLTFVLPQLAGSQQRLRAAKFEPELAALGHDSLHQLWLRDPAGHAVTRAPIRPRPRARRRNRCAGISRILACRRMTTRRRANSGRAPASWPCPRRISHFRICP